MKPPGWIKVRGLRKSAKPGHVDVEFEGDLYVAPVGTKLQPVQQVRRERPSAHRASEAARQGRAGSFASSSQPDSGSDDRPAGDRGLVRFPEGSRACRTSSASDTGRRSPMKLRVKPFASLYPAPPSPRCRLMFGAGLGYGEREASGPSGRIAIWAFRHRCLYQRTREPDGNLREHYKLSACWLELEVGAKVYRAVLKPHCLPRFEVDASTAPMVS